MRSFAATRWIRIISVFIVVFLGAVAIFLVATTIRLTIFPGVKRYTL